MSHFFANFENIMGALMWPLFAIVLLLFLQFVLNALSFLFQLGLPDWLFDPVFNVFETFTFRILHAIGFAGCVIAWVVKERMRAW